MTKAIRFLMCAAVMLVLNAHVALPQALPNLSTLRLSYNVRKGTVNPQGELKLKIDALDRELAEATRLGRIGEVRRLLAKGLTLLGGNEWTDVLDFSNSLAARADRVFVDPGRPYAVRLEQIYSPSIALERAVTARASLQTPRAPQPGLAGVGTAAPVGELVKDLGAFDEVSRDLRESPLLMELDLSGVANGAYQIHVDVLDGDRPLGSAALGVVVHAGLDAASSRLETEAARVPEALRADVLFPADYVRNVNRGRIARGAFDIAKEIADAEAVVAAAKAGKDPFAARTGDFKRHYLLKAAGEIMPYRLYVPTTYNPGRPHPLVVALHGLGGTEDSMFGQNYGLVPQAERRSYIVVAPLGYRVDGGYGVAPGAPANRRAQLSEQDVMEVLQRVRQQYTIDENRIYLMGHSLGAIGTWRLAANYPNIWAALGPIAGNGNPATMERMRHIPQIVVHGDADNVVSVNGSRAMVAELNKLGGEVKYIEVPGGGHSDIAGPNIPAILDFFDTHRKSSPAAVSAR